MIPGTAIECESLWLPIGEAAESWCSRRFHFKSPPAADCGDRPEPCLAASLAARLDCYFPTCRIYSAQREALGGCSPHQSALRTKRELHPRATIQHSRDSSQGWIGWTELGHARGTLPLPPSQLPCFMREGRGETLAPPTLPLALPTEVPLTVSTPSVPLRASSTSNSAFAFDSTRPRLLEVGHTSRTSAIEPVNIASFCTGSA